MPGAPKAAIARGAAACLLLLSATLMSANPAEATTTAVACGDVLTTDTTLTADLTCPAGALTIGADDVDLDLNGHTITGSGTGNGLKATGRQGTTVRNGTITGFTYAIYIDYGGAVLTATDVRLLAPVDVWPGTVTFTGTRKDACLLSGIRLVDGLLTVDRCTVTGQTVLVRSSGSTIRNSALTGGTLTVSATDRGVFTRNVFDAFPMGLSNDSRRNLVQGNVFKNSPTAGIGAGETFLPQDANTIEYNLFTGNDIGLHSSSMLKHLIVRRNVFNGNKTVGMFVENSYGSNRAGPDPVSDNVFVGNGHNPSGLVDRQGQVVQGGIHLASRLAVIPPVTLRNNVGTGNAGHLIWAPPGTVADGGGNQGPCGPSPNPDLTCW
ncbi:right-handed parallel beta-helix repeat-containing protein [Nonomuraea sp. NPDC001831]|uniref:right-handed parallel beta-helix repeat-containing protein n=1 Tax=Nonomuraea sp. NPDC001831 TaxID=3364340 RepID=UPI0036A7C0EA